MSQWIKDLWSWVRGFPRPWRYVRIHGDVISDGGTFRVGRGVTLVVEGNVRLASNVAVVAIASEGDVEVRGNLETKG